jgi:hypothetical protein
MFTIVHGVYLRDLRFPDPEQVVAIDTRGANRGPRAIDNWSAPDLEDVQESARLFDGSSLSPVNRAVPVSVSCRAALRPDSFESRGARTGACSRVYADGDLLARSEVSASPERSAMRFPGTSALLVICAFRSSFAQMLGRRTRSVTAVLVAVLAAGCGAEKSPTAPADLNRFQLSGLWRFSVTITIPPGGCAGAAIESGLEAHSTGTLSIAQDDINLTAIQSFDRGGNCTYQGVGGNRQGSANLTMVSCEGLDISFRCSAVRNEAGVVTGVGRAGDAALASRVIRGSYDVGKPVVDTLTGRLEDTYRLSYRQTDPPLDIDFVQTSIAIGNFTATRR